ncbi:glutamyl-tRNA amidotransferase [Thermotoga maritima MSB8]|uniref:Transamidase GatB domain protein n=1 Tax=Thermotoga maritima (strain ATCC 43589 / DSM 3109 / JCM 10099 / NBRC 100826 / MSB8) TaxID=243274 RepID=Q9WZF4_THEMA|nr:GatB/YqeY domain-containing protein [Thermotoga maritima]AAD35772.1 conserved hypothetical protein [Thermotoga maritima MSB8]AGL49615.1 Transamidase GatB domain protein [Thermotoga maritima MSB8]AHD17556.1 aspartyl-tRNA amidotransferase subunit B [Thermotoga maritima MSB8]AKE26608.1 glutamyl-tRNA amidotransferase [Thermotoga maritima]AKE28472.1 glutamyl-tRNA amidotransferase [Thermotoga maritima MSB8]
MSLKEKLMSDLKEAMKNKDMVRMNTLRMILTTLKNLEVEKMKEATDEEVMEALMKEAKKRREAIEEYEKHGREELAEKERKELEIIESYLPKQLSEDEIRKIVMEAINEVGASSPKDLGKVMKVVMPKVKGRADGKLVNKMVREILESL